MNTGRGQQHGARQREARAPPAPSAAPPSGGKAPRFGYLLKLGLESIGVRYISMDLLRKAKKGHTSEREYWALWRLLHDVVLVVLADFAVDVREMERLNSPERLESALLDPELHCIQMELVRFYLYEWGFVCGSFYAGSALSSSGHEAQRPSSQVLLLAFAWLVAFSRFFERQQRSILESLTASERTRLPPFPNDIDLDPESLQSAALEAVSSAGVPRGKSLPLNAQIHQLHSVFGRLQSHLNELQAYTRYHERLVRRLEEVQNVPEEHRDELLPAYVLHLLAGPRTRLIAQVRLLEKSVQMLEDEALFYKWINSLVLSLNHDNGTPNAQIESLAASNSGVYTALFAQIQDVQALFQAHASSFQQIVHGYEEERKKWKTRQKSRSRLQQLDTKVERFTHEVQTRELFDPQKLFLRSERSWVILRLKDGVEASQAVDGKPHLPTVDEVERLQKQLENVIGEITREYCGVHLR